jgi:anti-sigma regulatory factor (Ser/Thr protein kinase)
VPGVPSIVGTARRLVRLALSDSPRVDDIELIASELVTNAIRHTSTESRTSAVTLRLLVESSRVRVEVLDLGRVSWVRPATPVDEDEDECGRGLLIVDALADRAGHDPVPLGQISWAEVSWAEPRIDITPGVARRHRRRRDTRTSA